ncbi:putative tartrate transporter [Zancudomyces culisetae]|uniref:Putative tartrate transporter n=1 Tax=Zancudomyces culisetae TaxID=1213189 RepID=A0A1R1PTV1_ZANCU|nr:putative tartrate transporter [Zancudomyces culisetae]|eukprot:OMH84388.1 putative tartrate transporter [Zancudomyces culisetae]
MKGEEVTLGDEKIAVNTQIALTAEELIHSKKALRKLDTRLLPIIVILYVGSLMDRGFGYSYVLHILHNSGASSKHTVEETCMLQAVAKTASLFIVFRSILGAVEAGFSPGMVAYLPYWYTREEIGFRMGVFFASLPISAMVGSPLAGALASVKSSLKPYQMIFLVEGGITLIFGVASYFILENYPETCTILTTEEKTVLLKKLRADQGLATRSKLSFWGAVRAIFDWKTAIYCIGNLAIINGLNFVGIFGPTLLKGLGYSSVTATYMTGIPGAAGLISLIASLYIPKRVPLFVNIIAMLGFETAALFLMYFGSGKTLKIIAFVCVGIGLYPSFPIFLSWMSVNQGGIGKRLVVSAVVFSIGNLSGAIIPVMLTTKYLPRFTLGYMFIAGFNLLTIVLTFILAMYFKKVNSNRDKHAEDVSHLTEVEQEQLYDDHPQFRYIL